jgi:regulator of replication initiation timing
MTKEKIPSDLFETLRNAGFQLETQLNEYIHKYMNHKEFAAAASVFKKAHGKLMEMMQEVHETASPHLNTPTKKDLANIAKLIVQLEEKIDALNDQVAELTETLHDSKNENTVTMEPADLQDEPAESETPKEARLKRLQALSELAKNPIGPQLDALAASSEKLGKTHFTQLLEMLQGMKKGE